MPAEVPSKERIPAAQRREMVLDAAAVEFGSRGYAGTTTDRIARAAGISQPYVVRMFGTKEELFLETVTRAQEDLRRTVQQVIAEVGKDDPQALVRAIGRTYVDLVTDRPLLRVLMQSFLTGTDPTIGPVARAGFLSFFRVLRDDAGFDPDRVREFLAQGMLINTVLALDLHRHDLDPDASAVLTCAFGDKAADIVAAGETA
ncbi:TetR family transcriptional regulator [Nakamurella sp. YIM 132087]|uniref:TetR family transcriptional regulator n=1 Tax=Nakamurella alba TaxID=2665158 RepID=A0A7K1FLU6_9ACTN|nr:TetR/AcrR family transcriptional regulator [Nakamurella alba]MTD14213.1 TetR family transcriptional regulator [Nakamurella alba]